MSEHITHQPQIKRLERSSSGRMVAGVAGGLGRYFEINPAVFRLGFVVLTLLSGAGILVYLAALLVIPAEGEEDSIASRALAERREKPWPVAGLGLAAVALVVLLSHSNAAVGAGWIFVLLAGLVILWLGRRQGRSKLLIALTALFALLAIGVITAVITAFAWFNVSLGDGTGERTYTPTNATLAHDYHLGVGHLEVDLSRVDTTVPHHVAAGVGIGELKVIVPHDADVSVDAHAKAGELHVLGASDDGRNASISTGSGTFEIDADIGAGRIDVVRAG
jgi:phage shock protein PspC (stress-responsive transcriptional regulator)